jgi:cell division protein FtsB
VPHSVCALYAAVLTLAQPAGSSPAQPSGPPPPSSNWMPVAVVVAAVVGALTVWVLNRRRNRIDTLDKLTQTFKRQLETADQLQQERDRLQRWARKLDAREKQLAQREAALDELARRRRGRRPEGGGEAS